MGTNIYMRRKEPRTIEVYDEVHVGKLSYGWRAHFDGSSMYQDQWYPERDDNLPRIGSMDDLRAYLATGEWELFDEYGEKTTLEEVLDHDKFMKDGKLWNTRVSMDDYYDREGYPWSRREFF